MAPPSDEEALLDPEEVIDEAAALLTRVSPHLAQPRGGAAGSELGAAAAAFVATYCLLASAEEALRAQGLDDDDLEELGELAERLWAARDGA